MSNVQMVFIYNGLFHPFGADGFLEWQILHEDGSEAHFDYRGEAGFDGVNLRIVSNSGVQIHDYIVSQEPTESSVLFQKGYDMGMKQRRRKCPSSQPERVIDGWLFAWNEKKEKSDVA